MKKDSNFIERRKEHRLPYHDKVVFTDGTNSGTAYAANISRGGVFVMSLDPYTIDTQGYLAFRLNSHPQTLCVKSKVVHVVYDRQRCEIENGMGFQFMELNEQQKTLVNLHITNEKNTYIELKRILAAAKPDPTELARCLKKMPSLQRFDLLGLRYKVNRICTIFEAAPDVSEAIDAQDGDEKTMIA